MEHYDGVLDKDKDKMTEDELNFHYFKVHDYDNNNMLDGIELVSALTHYHRGQWCTVEPALRDHPIDWLQTSSQSAVSVLV